jgi:hypothetical protein
MLLRWARTSAEPQYSRAADLTCSCRRTAGMAVEQLVWEGDAELRSPDKSPGRKSKVDGKAKRKSSVRHGSKAVPPPAPPAPSPAPPPAPPPTPPPAPAPAPSPAPSPAPTPALPPAPSPAPPPAPSPVRKLPAQPAPTSTEDRAHARRVRMIHEQLWYRHPLPPSPLPPARRKPMGQSASMSNLSLARLPPVRPPVGSPVGRHGGPLARDTAHGEETVNATLDEHEAANNVLDLMAFVARARATPMPTFCRQPPLPAVQSSRSGAASVPPIRPVPLQQFDQRDATSVPPLRPSFFQLDPSNGNDHRRTRVLPHLSERYTSPCEMDAYIAQAVRAGGGHSLGASGIRGPR